MSRHLLRPGGVQGLFTVLFSEEDISGDDAPLEKLEQIARLLKATPSGIPEQVCIVAPSYAKYWLIDLHRRTMLGSRGNCSHFCL